MTFTVNIIYSGAPGAAQAFAKEMQSTGTVEKIRAEAGNIRYGYFQPLDDPNAILLIDEWQDQAALDTHHKSPMMTTIAELRDKYKLRMTVTRYQQIK